MWIKLALICQHLGLALLIGGLLALGAFTAPVLFKSFDRDAAGQAMALIFRRYDVVLFISIALIAIGELLRSVVAGWGGTPVSWLRLGFTITLIATVLASTFGTNAQLSHLYANGQQHTPAFQQAHMQSEKLAKAQLGLGVLLLILSLLG